MRAKTVKRKVAPKIAPTVAILERIRHLAGLGMTQDEIAHSLSISSKTWYTFKKRHPEAAVALSDGRGCAVEAVANKLYEDALAGNTTAQIFFLKNRAPDRWRDRKEHEHTGEVNIKDFVMRTVAEQMAEDEQPTTH